MPESSCLGLGSFFGVATDFQYSGVVSRRHVLRLVCPGSLSEDTDYELCRRRKDASSPANLLSDPRLQRPDHSDATRLEKNASDSSPNG